MEFGRVLQVTLDDIPHILLIDPLLPIDSLPFQLPNPEEAGHWQELGHYPSMQVVCVPVDDVAEGFLDVEVAHMRIVGFGITLATHAHATTDATLDHEVHRGAGEEVQLHARHLEYRIPRHLGWADSGRDLPRNAPLHSHLAEILEHAGVNESIDYSSQEYFSLTFYGIRNIKTHGVKI